MESGKSYEHLRWKLCASTLQLPETNARAESSKKSQRKHFDPFSCSLDSMNSVVQYFRYDLLFTQKCPRSLFRWENSIRTAFRSTRSVGQAYSLTNSRIPSDGNERSGEAPSVQQKVLSGISYGMRFFCSGGSWRVDPLVFDVEVLQENDASEVDVK